VTRSILSCSGAHWMRWFAAWSFLSIALAGLIGDAPADTAAGQHGSTTDQPLVTGSIAPPLTPSPGQLIVHRVASFDFNQQSRASFGDAEADLPGR